ncbi:hypothetical protein EIN_429020 [Entamoeba invadens IP1]|uniref:Ubiquitin carboxyl-terminal hydrolase n=1 Tax=Entamoeba invadens IP1 TaxID=370355 RepID=A0A0A1UEX3_ENTIV|nr:hypothetical protein EIN_429020 [Entamoeba invadens IP1]ELP95156.1 hypothetical protein EIN_429020 [Entamoeba invadens IP1]|eukprot:XP_004261927.1 hypothetical protein EIN_429020 [Entamoeba invadens IP1]
MDSKNQYSRFFKTDDKTEEEKRKQHAFLSANYKKYFPKPATIYISQNVKGVRGIKNLGNTCYLNSSLQCLLHIPSFVNYFQNVTWQSEINKTNALGTQGKLVTKFAELVNDYYSDKTQIIDVTELKKEIDTAAPYFLGFDQHDSQELTSVLLDKIAEDLNRNAKFVDKNTTEKGFEKEEEYDGKNEAKWAELEWKNYLKHTNSIITDVFTGVYKSRLLCDVCRNENVRFEPFVYLQLALPQQPKVIKFIIFDRYLKHIKSFEIDVTYKTQEGVLNEVIGLYRAAGGKMSHSYVVLDLGYKNYVTKVHEANYFTEGSECAVVEKQSECEEFVVYDVVVNYSSYTTYRVPLVFPRSVQLDAVDDAVYQLVEDDISVSPNDDWLERPYNDLSGNCLSNGIDDKKEGDGIKEDEKIEAKSCSLDVNSLHINTSESPKKDQVKVKTIGESLKHCLSRQTTSQKEIEVQNLLTTTVEEHKESQTNILVLSTNKEKDINNSTAFETSLPKVQTSQSEMKKNPPETEKMQKSPTKIFQKIPHPTQDHNFKIIFSQENGGIVRGETLDAFAFRYIEIYTSPYTKQEQTKVTLTQLLETFQEEESLNNENKALCTKCKEVQPSHKKIELYKTSEVFVIHLKRFLEANGNLTEKVTTLVEFPVNDLDLRKYVKCYDQKTLPIYSLCAICNHSGSINFGHYTTSAKVGNKWYNFNDSITSEEKNENDLVTANAYVLYYIRK